MHISPKRKEASWNASAQMAQHRRKEALMMNVDTALDQIAEESFPPHYLQAWRDLPDSERDAWLTSHGFTVTVTKDGEVMLIQGDKSATATP